MTLNYDLAVQLKKSGFPQKERSIIVGNEDQFIPDPTRLNMYIYSPTLSELIEACDDEKGFGLEVLRVSYDGRWQKYWIAESCPRRGSLRGSGKTPEEAVANLYLVLHPIEPEI